ncbi:MAG: hypothetical protein LUQ31_00365 [Methanoregula sp.]|nr:hypothetical protein [Methanoregula sp.]
MHVGLGIICVLLGAIIFTSGCLSSIFPDPVAVTPSPAPTPVPTTESPVETLPLSQLAILPDELPSDYILKERSDRTYLETDTISRDLGWKAGYIVTYYRVNREKYDMTGFSQTIDLYSLDSMNMVFNVKKEDIISQENETIKIYVLPCKKMGENTFAYKTVNEKNPRSLSQYTIIFTRKNVYEELTMGGTTTDYETLKDLAQTAADKIQ